MQQYYLRRFLLVFPTIIFVSIVVFTLMRLLPGDTVDLMIRENRYAPSAQAMRHQLGLDKPFHEQYIDWVGGLMRGDLGQSLWTRHPVIEDLKMRVPVSFELSLFSLLISVAVAVPVGVISALRQESWLDYLCRSLSIALLSIPGFWIATLIITYPSIWFKWTPSIRFVPFDKDPVGNLTQFLIPALIMGSAMSGSLMRITRSMMLEVLRQDYVRTGWGKGLNEHQVLYRHALKNAMIPIISVLGMLVPIVLGGSVIIENIFNLPGLGSLLLETVARRDYPVLQSVNLVFALIIIMTNLLVDLSYAYLDPRIRYR